MFDLSVSRTHADEGEQRIVGLVCIVSLDLCSTSTRVLFHSQGGAHVYGIADKPVPLVEDG